jgi:hypothetical protein
MKVLDSIRQRPRRYWRSLGQCATTAMPQTETRFLAMTYRPTAQCLQVACSRWPRTVYACRLTSQEVRTNHEPDGGRARGTRKV